MSVESAVHFLQDLAMLEIKMTLMRVEHEYRTSMLWSDEARRRLHAHQDEYVRQCESARQRGIT